jgi:hypothetical protein
MTEERNKLAELFAACWKDDAVKQRFMADPKAVLAEYGMDVPDGMNVNVVENADNTVHITMPAPPSGHQDLSDDELQAAAGGGGAAAAQTSANWMDCEDLGMQTGL